MLPSAGFLEFLPRAHMAQERIPRKHVLNVKGQVVLQHAFEIH
jgi:hypothetical protein